MASRGVYFALTADEESALLAASSDEDVLEILQEEIEERWNEEWLAETDKAWDALHRCLGDGTLALDATPLAKCVLGGRQLHDGDDYIVSYLTALEVKSLVAPLDQLDDRWFAARYATLAETDYDGPCDKDDQEYTWESFEAMRDLFRRAGTAGRAVVFTVDP